ncbi:MAG: serine/threonine protein kinase [Deltaproteobacteria bacterium]|nr:serine/threonine protein kinase [Deltaproteobacteria bacterium]
MEGKPHSGQRLAGYTLGERIAIGGMAEIYCARDPRTQQNVVLKVLLPQHARDADFVQMLADEARLTAALDHPTLIHTLDFVQPTEGAPFLVMEYVDGASLAHLLEAGAHAPLSPEIALSLAHRLLGALEYIHQRCDDEGASLAIVHRDVTPANVLVRRDGVIKLGDFGIARSRLRHTRTRTGVVKGTVQYMSPEQICGDDCDARSDIYGVGLILFELLTGKAYIEGEREVDLLRCAEDPPWRPPSQEHPALDGAFDKLLQPALSVFPEQRYPHAGAMREALRACAAKVGLSLTDDATIAAWAQPLLPPKRHLSPIEGHDVSEASSRGGRWLAALLMAILALSAGAYALLSRGQRMPGATSAADATLQRDILVPDMALARADAGELRPDARKLQPNAGALQADAQPDTKRRAAQRVHRSKVPRQPRAPDAAPRATAKDEGVAGRAFAARYAALREGLRRRSISKTDLSNTHQSELKALAPRPGAKPPSPQIVTRLARLEGQLAALVIDRAFVQRKLRRVDARLRVLPKTRADLPHLERNATQALQAVMDGRLVQANRLLQQLEAQLRRVP